MSVKTIFHGDCIERLQDVEPIIENNKRLKNEEQNRKSNFRHVASVPCIFIEKWLKEEWDRGNRAIRWNSPEYYALVEKKLRDPDYAFLRTDK